MLAVLLGVVTGYASFGEVYRLAFRARSHNHNAFESEILHKRGNVEFCAERNIHGFFGRNFDFLFHVRNHNGELCLVYHLSVNVFERGGNFGAAYFKTAD